MNKIQRLSKVNISLVGLLFAVIFAATPLFASAAVAISPTSLTAYSNMPVSFTVTGLTASTPYDVGYTLDGGDYVSITENKTSTSAGEITFTFIPTDEGDYLVKILTGIDGAAGTGVLQVSSSLSISDLIGFIFPYLILIASLTIVFSIFGVVNKMLKKF